jgi:hypothetical protein
MSRSSSLVVLQTPAQFSANNSPLRLTSPSEERWAQALALLNENDRLQLHIDTNSKDYLGILNEVLDIAEEKKKLCREKAWKYKKRNGKVIIIRDLLEKLVGWVKRFREVVDVAVSYDPGHAALPWAALRFLLTIAIQDTQIFGAMMEGIGNVALLVARYALLERIYVEPELDDETGIERALVDLYVGILKFESSAIRFYGAKKTGKSR